MRQLRHLPHGWIVWCDDNLYVLCHQYGGRMISKVVDQFEHLIRHRINFDCDISFLDQLNQLGMLYESIAVTDALCAQQNCIDLKTQQYDQKDAKIIYTSESYCRV